MYIYIFNRLYIYTQYIYIQIYTIRNMYVYIHAMYIYIYTVYGICMCIYICYKKNIHTIHISRCKVYVMLFYNTILTILSIHVFIWIHYCICCRYILCTYMCIYTYNMHVDTLKSTWNWGNKQNLNHL